MAISFATYYVVATLVNSAIGLYNSRASRHQQSNLAERNHQLNVDIERNRQDFQLELNARNQEAQRQLALENHNMRLQEQQHNFEILCRQIEYNRFMTTWPLVNVPSVIRSEQILPDNTVSLRVFFLRNSDQIFSNCVYPKLEQGLRDFVDIYHNNLGSRNITFYHNGFTGQVTGGAVEENLHYALKELPVIIIDSNVLPDEICVSLTMWGLGSKNSAHFTVFRIPYERRVTNGSIDMNYFNSLSYKMLACLKFVLGYAYDAYNLIQYDRMPLFPSAADIDFKNNMPGAVLLEPEVTKIIGDKYDDIYSLVIGNGTQSTASYADSESSCKKSILHILRLQYAEALKSYISPDKFQRCLDESLEAWCALRSQSLTLSFLEELAKDKSRLKNYFSRDDVEYFFKLRDGYASCGSSTEYSNLISSICTSLNDVDAKVVLENNLMKRTPLIGNASVKSQNKWIEL